MNDAILILVRHGQSTWNQQNVFTGWVDITLSKKGIAEAKEAGKKLAKKNLLPKMCFVSSLMRAKQTLLYLLEQIQLPGPLLFIPEEKKLLAWSKHSYKGKYLPVYVATALNERYYGKLQGLNKEQTAKTYGERQVQLWRRSYEINPPGGESLKDTVERTVPYYKKNIVPALKKNNCVLIAAHGNSLRAITKYLEQISDADIANLEIPTGVPIVYWIEKRTMKIKKKEML
ncbi:MAG: 2,3-bisphosphoglycerate-dependent phosphoglycerate mutase [Candidatus Woesearchaeota archaeon]